MYRTYIYEDIIIVNVLRTEYFLSLENFMLITLIFSVTISNNFVCFKRFDFYRLMPTAHYTTRHDKTTPDKKIV